MSPAWPPSPPPQVAPIPPQAEQASGLVVLRPQWRQASVQRVQAEASASGLVELRLDPGASAPSAQEADGSEPSLSPAELARAARQDGASTAPAPPGDWPALARLDIEGPLPEHEKDALRLALPIAVDDPLDPERVRATVRAAFATGRFQDVRAYVVGDGPRRVMRLVVVRQRVVVGWRFEGNAHLNAEALARCLDLSWGQLLAPEGFASWPKLIAERYQREGYPQARLKPGPGGEPVTMAPEGDRPDRVQLVIRVDEGAPVTVGGVSVVVAAKRPSAATVAEDLAGAPSGTWADESEAQAVARLLGQARADFGLKPGQVLGREAFFGGVEAVEARLAASGFTNSRASFSLSRPGLARTANFGAAVAAGPGAVDLTLALELGPRALVTVAGPVLFSEGDLNGAITVHKNRSTSTHELELSRDALKALYAERGYPEAEVSFRLRRLPQEVDWVAFEVQPGPQRIVGRLRIEGAQAIPEATVRGWLATRPENLLGGGAFVPATWAEDVAAVKAQYLALGFPRVQVTELPRELDPNTGRVRLGLRIVEGPRRVITRLLLEGANATDEAGLLQALGIEPGDAFGGSSLSDAVAGAKAYYAKVGHPLSSAEASYAEGEPTDGIVPGTLRLKVSAGPLKRFGRVIVRGNLTTLDHVVARQVTVVPGGPYNAEQLLATQQAIYQLGFFDRVRVVPARPLGEDPRDPVDLLIEVHERETGFFALGGGFSDLGLAGTQLSAEYTQMNWQGRGIPVRTETIFSAPKTAFNFSVRDPYLLGLPLMGEAALNAVRERASDTLVSQRYGPSFGLSRQLSPVLTGSVRYGWARIDYPEASVLDLVSLGGVPNRIDSIFSAGLVHDSRSDLFNPRYGTRADFSADVATPFLNGTLRYLRPKLSLAHFIPVRAWRLTTLAFGLDANFIMPILGTPALPDDLRFQLGGANSLRGYDQRQVGRPTAEAPNGVVAPGFGVVAPGGELALVGHAELRYPLPWVDGLGGVAFVDAGNVWGSPSELLGLAVKANAGLGLRYLTPIGPVRLDVASRMWPQFQALGGVYVGLGQAF